MATRANTQKELVAAGAVFAACALAVPDENIGAALRNVWPDSLTLNMVLVAAALCCTGIFLVRQVVSRACPPPKSSDASAGGANNLAISAKGAAHDTLESDLRRGIARDEIVPYYQPIVDLDTREVLGFEALARWNHPALGILGADRFIGLAEDTGLIGDVFARLLHRACIDAREWPADTFLSVNISPIQLLDPWLPQRVLETLRVCDLPAHRLIVEVTESRVVGDFSAAAEILAALEKAGIQIALDDFGTGYASLKHLRELAFTRLKIDRGFVQDIGRSENREIVRAVLNLSGALNLTATAEGIETEQVATLLRALGCRQGQGYLFSPPVPARAACELARHRFTPLHAHRATIAPPLAALGARTLH